MFRPVSYTGCNFNSILNDRFIFQTAAIFCIISSIFIQFLQLIVNSVHNDLFTELDPEISTLLDLLELLTIFLVGYSIYRCKESYLIPAMGFNFVFVCSLVVYTFMLITTNGLEDKAAVYNQQEEKHSNIFRILVFIYFSIYQIWFTSIMLALYNYIGKKRIRKNTIRECPRIIVNPNYEN